MITGYIYQNIDGSLNPSGNQVDSSLTETNYTFLIQYFCQKHVSTYFVHYLSFVRFSSLEENKTNDPE